MTFTFYEACMIFGLGFFVGVLVAYKRAFHIWKNAYIRLAKKNGMC